MMYEITDNYEQKYWKENKIVAGVDEAGRGCLAGPVVAAAVVLPMIDFLNYGINDSKKLSAKKRDELFQVIAENALTYSYEMLTNEYIDENNILNSAMDAMRISVEKLSIKPDHLLIDGNRYYCNNIPYTTIIGGDGISISIASASIIAKVSRDKWMIEIADKEYPEYGFAKHKGYATKDHYKAIEKYGICPIHRRTFLKSLFYHNQNSKTIFD